METPRQKTIHVLSLFHTITSNKFSHCAFTGKVLRFAKMMKMYGYHVIEYGNGESESEADEKVQMMSESRLLQMIKRKTDDPNQFVGMDAVIGSPAWTIFNSMLIEKISSRAKEGDIVAHTFGKVRIF